MSGERGKRLGLFISIFKTYFPVSLVEKYLNHLKFRGDSLETNGLKWEQVENRKRVLNEKQLQPISFLFSPAQWGGGF